VHYLNRFLVSTGEPEHLGQIVAGTGDLQMTATQAPRNVSYAVGKSVGRGPGSYLEPRSFCFMPSEVEWSEKASMYLPRIVRSAPRWSKHAAT
jgi:hypothetical protein